MQRKQKILLAQLPQWSIDQPPLGIAFLAAYLRKYDYEVILKDFNIQLFAELPGEKKTILEANCHLNWIGEQAYFDKIHNEIDLFLKQWADEIISSDAEVIGFTVLETNQLPVLQVARHIKEKASKKIIIVGGPQVSRNIAAIDFAKKDFIDFVVPGEGEAVLKNLLDTLYSDRDPLAVKGVIFKKGGEIIDTGKAEFIDDLNKLPFPAIEDFPFAFYHSPVIPLMGSRGCIYRCAFCGERPFWEHYRYRTAENIFEEMKSRHDRFGPRYLYLVDSLINGKPCELERLCDLLIAHNLEITWGGKASIRKEMDRNLLIKMRRAGCVNIQYGLESASDSVLKDMNKAHDTALSSKVIKETAEAGIKVQIFWLIGFPTEKDTDFEESMDFLNTYKTYIDGVTPGYGCGLLPGSELFANQKKYGIYWKGGEWYSAATSPHIRSQRVNIFKDFCKSLNIRVDY